MPTVETRSAAPSGVSSAPARRYSPLLDAIRVLAVIAVVAVHVIADHLEEGDAGPLTVLRAVLATAVPAFVMISGALNLDPAAMRHGTSAFLLRRLGRLVPAWIVWTAFYAVVMTALLADEPFDARRAVADLLTASTYPHLYFLPLIIGLMVVTPVLAAFVGESARRLWWTGGLAAAWAASVMAIPSLSDSIVGETVAPLQLGLLTYFLPFIGYYVLGRAAWTAPPRRTVSAVLLGAAPLLLAINAWAYASPVTDSDGGRALLPTYLSPTVMALSLALVIGVMGVGRDWEVGDRAARMLRTLGNATFGVFLVHFAVLVPLRGLGFPEDSAFAVAVLIVVVTAVSFAFSLLGARVPGLRRLL